LLHEGAVGSVLRGLSGLALALQAGQARAREVGLEEMPSAAPPLLGIQVSLGVSPPLIGSPPGCLGGSRELLPIVTGMHRVGSGAGALAVFRR
jgi:hypothetical protein